MNLALVYQAGIANVFEIERFSLYSRCRGKTTRKLQHAFRTCEWYVRGAKDAGAIVRVYSCNVAGDCAEVDWTAGTDATPFRDQANPPK